MIHFRDRTGAKSQVLLPADALPSPAHESISMTAVASRTFAARFLAIRPAALTAGIVWLAALTLYAVTAGPGIVELFDDSLEFQYVAPTLGIAHPTGYPLYTLSGALWSRVLFPFGNWAWRMNIFSAVTAATAVLMVYLIGVRLVPHTVGQLGVWAGLTAAAAFSLGPVWWGQATVAEVYALHGLLMAAILLTTLTIPPLAASLEPSARSRTSRRITLLGLLIGLSLAHHRTSVLILPGVAVFLLWSVPGLWRPRRQWLLWLGAVLLPLALYAYLPLRSAQGISDLNRSYTNTVQGFLDHVLARQYAGFFAGNVWNDPLSVGDGLRLIWRQLGAAAGILALTGLAVMPLGRDGALRKWTLLVLVLAANLIFAMCYQVADQEVFFIPAILVLALFAGVGAAIAARLSGRRPRLATAVAAALAIVVVLGPIGRGAPVNRRDDWSAHQYAYLLANVAYPPQSRVIALEGETTALKYMQASQKLGQNALPVTADDPVLREKAIAESVAMGRPVYLTRELPGIETLYSFSGDGPLVRVWPRGAADVEPLPHPLDVELMDGRLRLQGYALRNMDVPGGSALELTLGWLPAAGIDRTVKVSLRLLDETGAPVLDADRNPVVEDRFPILQLAPSSAWPAGTLVRDVHILSVPGRRSAAPAALQVIVYDAHTVDELARFQLPIP